MTINGTELIALYAAVVATGTLGWRIFEWNQEKQKIKVAIMFAQQINIPGVDPTKIFISLKAMNVGQRATTLEAAGFKLSNDMDLTDLGLYLHDKILPKRLNPGESVSVMFDPENLKEELGKVSPEATIEFAFFRDQGNRVYKSKLQPNVRKIFQS
jgi:hypothetical protein